MTIATPIEELASYVPWLILRRMVGDSGFTLTPSADRFPAAVLLADISGFTALTEHLTLNNPAGAEDLTRILDLYFGHLIEVINAHGGDVVKFAGDGVVALWYSDDPLSVLALRAVQCGLAVQMMMAPSAWSVLDDRMVHPPSPLKVRVGVSAGEIGALHVGGMYGRWELLVTGEALRRAGRAETQAQPGDVAIDARAWCLVSEACVGTLIGPEVWRLDALADTVPMRAVVAPVLQPAMALPLRAYVPKAILASLDAGQSAWMTEQRRVTVLFINLTNLADDIGLRDAQLLMRTVQSMLYRYEGSLTRLGFDAKGPTLVAAMGLPPLSHEDDPRRGVRAALAIEAALHELGVDCAIGVTTGRVLCGAVGSRTRREYTMMGSVVNRAARLMQTAAVVADSPRIMCDDLTWQATHRSVAFVVLEPLQLKGFAAPVRVYRPIGDPSAVSPVLSGDRPQTVELLGRERERAAVTALLSAGRERREPSVLVIEGEPGIGKSQLVDYLCLEAQRSGIRVLRGSAGPVAPMPYDAWRLIVADLIDTGLSLSDVLAEDLATLLQPLPVGEGSDLIEGARPSGQIRVDTMRERLIRLMAHAVAEESLVLVFENAQWLDASSWALVQTLCDQALPVLIVLAVRTMAAPPQTYQRLIYRSGTTYLRLNGLDPEALHTLLASRAGTARIDEPVLALILTRTSGNPFFSLELLDALRAGDLVVCDSAACRVAPGVSDLADALQQINISETVQGLVTSRIDRLAAEHQLTLKVASVIGLQFTLAELCAIHPFAGHVEQFVEHLFVLQQAGLVLVEAFEPELIYGFKHAIAREVAYNLMSFSQRRQLHQRLAERLEQYQAPSGYARLAHHWYEAGDHGRSLCYLALAGEQALQSGAVGEAIELLQRVLQLADESEPSVSDGMIRARWDRLLGEAYHGMGRLPESRAVLERAVARLEGAIGREPGRLILLVLGSAGRQVVRRVWPLADPVCTDSRQQAHWLEAARAFMLLGHLAYYDSRPIEMLALILRGLNLAEQCEPSPVLIDAYATVAVASCAWRPLARLYLYLARTRLVGRDDVPVQAWIAEAHALVALAHTDWRRARAALTLATSIADHVGDRRRQGECQALAMFLAAQQGDLHQALALSRVLADLASRLGDVQMHTWALTGQAEYLLELGATEQAWQRLGEAEALLAENVGGAHAEEIGIYGLMSLVALERGEPQLAYRLAEASLDLLEHHTPTAIYSAGGYAALAEVLLRLRATGAVTHERSEILVQQVCRSLGWLARLFPLVRPAWHTWQGLADTLAGRRRAGLRHWRRAAAEATRRGMPLAEARARYHLSRYTRGRQREQSRRRAAALFGRAAAVRMLVCIPTA
jgi:class 3 adenylate cyclase/tetratricopeptide (TPR) repeat protein